MVEFNSRHVLRRIKLHINHISILSGCKDMRIGRFLRFRCGHLGFSHFYSFPRMRTPTWIPRRPDYSRRSRSHAVRRSNVYSQTGALERAGNNTGRSGA